MKPNLTVWLGKTVCVQVDRPIHSRHPDRPSLTYELNYGFIPDTVSGDLEPIDAYILGIEQPLKSFKGIVIAVLVRIDDVEDKLVVASPDAQFSDAEITPYA